MKNIVLPTFALIIISFTACHTNTPEDDATTSPATSIATDTTTSISNDTTKATVTTNNKTTSPLPYPQRASTALNPQHGQPGHRCDIAVGAPLNSPTQSIQQTMPATPTLPLPPLPPANTSGSVRLNPAHGQPGHDCTIPVGQPLKS